METTPVVAFDFDFHLSWLNPEVIIKHFSSAFYETYAEHVGCDISAQELGLVISVFGMNEEAGEIRESSSLEGYEKLRKVGKGAFGIAVLYRKIANDTLVVMKEISMAEMKSAERQLALNEVQVLKILDHPNIIRYHRSFEKDGTLFIEMEYADGGTLAQFLSRQLEPLKEVDILLMFRQIVCAIKYVHGFNIVHRDLKTANVFLTKEKAIKIGDFGISKVMTTASQAQSVLGTPYYISPEMCEGKEYGRKSDIWALGCILYEMTCLQKAFDGTNLPALVNKIMQCKFQPIPSAYSSSLRQLIQDLLQKDPLLRPSAADLFDHKLPLMLNNHIRPENGDPPSRPESLSHQNYSFNTNEKIKRSVLFELAYSEGFTSLIPIPLPPKIKIKEIAVSTTHFIALTTELEVYSWGEGGKGQLGHENTVAWNETPKVVEALRDKNIRTITAGDGFSVFGSESGMLLTCGDGTFGCLGHGDWSDLARPKIVEKLLAVDITAISCGHQHVLALTAEGVLYSWGRGLGGRLGLGHEEDSCSPSIVPLPDQITIRSMRCGADATMVIASNGILLACGMNNYNKLGLSSWQFSPWLKFQETEKSLTLQRVVSITKAVSDVSLGPSHTTVLTSRGQVITMGRNSEGQKGIKNTKQSIAPSYVKSLSSKIATMVKTGPAFSIIATVENEIYFWGTRKYKMSNLLTRSYIQDSRSASERFQSHFQNVRDQELILEPKEILALYASAQQIEKGETLNLAGIYVSQNSIFVLVDTTVPLFTKRKSKNGK